MENLYNIRVKSYIFALKMLGYYIYFVTSKRLSVDVLTGLTG